MTTDSSTTSPRGFHHVAFACRDLAATTHFYEDLMGFPLVHTEINTMGNGFFRHVFYDLGDGSAIAFFDLHEAGEREGWETAISTGNGLPIWVNHVSFKADADKQETVRAAMAAEGIKPKMEVDHGWCYSLYFTDPNGILVELCRDTPGFTSDPARAHVDLTAVPG
jgi:catechol 2,3-dioxygenase-like lactoylglutathione lyase family enzyme